MPVYKLCMKITKKNIPNLLIYIIVFLIVSSIMAASVSRPIKEQEGFSRVKTNIAFINEEESPLIAGLKDELGKVANFVELPDETEALQDALFFRRIVYILRIPQGFTRRFLNSEDIYLEKTIVPDSYSSAYIDLSIDKYLNTANLYIRHMDSITQEKLVSYLKEDLSKETNVEIPNSELKSDLNYSNYFFNYLAYSLLSILILGMSALMISYNDRDLKRRTGCSPLSDTASNLQFIFANLTFALVSWLMMAIFCLIIDVKNILTLNTFYFIISSFIFAFCGSGMGFLIGSVAKGNEAISAITNVVVLGSSFLSGVFVPVEFLGSTALKIASFMPTYWYVKANNQIAQLTHFDFDYIKPVLSDMAIVFCFGIAFFALSLVVRKNRQYS
ncbi:MAG: ABC transporter permease [Clostridiaceae bacterium]|nr:ABC transporter permease [Clostridiaceae bacterium]